MGLAGEILEFIRNGFPNCVSPTVLKPDVLNTHIEVEGMRSQHDSNYFLYPNLSETENLIVLDDSTGSWRRISTSAIKCGDEYKEFLTRKINAVLLETCAQILVLRMDHCRKECPIPKEKTHDSRYGEQGSEKRTSSKINWEEVAIDEKTGERSLFSSSQLFPENFNTIFNDPVARAQFNKCVLETVQSIFVPPGKKIILDGVTGQYDVRQFNEHGESKMNPDIYYLARAEADIGIPFWMDLFLKEYKNPTFVITTEDSDLLIVLLLFINQHAYSPCKIFLARKYRYITINFENFSEKSEQQQYIDIVALHKEMSVDSTVEDICALFLMCKSDYTEKLPGIGFESMLEAFVRLMKTPLTRYNTKKECLEVNFKAYCDIILNAFEIQYNGKNTLSFENIDALSAATQKHFKRKAFQLQNESYYRVQCAQLSWALKYYAHGWNRQYELPSGIGKNEGWHKHTFTAESGETFTIVETVDHVDNLDFY